jgi:hypothetical protein
MRLVAVAASVLAFSLSPARLFADSFTQINLVSNGFVPAATIDSNLVNPWGIAFSATSPFWISDQGTGVATVYTGTGSIVSLVVTVPGGGPPSGPTGQVFNTTASFALPSGGTTNFIFDTLNGTIAARSTGSTAVTVAPLQAPSTPASRWVASAATTTSTPQTPPAAEAFRSSTPTTTTSQAARSPARSITHSFPRAMSPSTSS